MLENNSKSSKKCQIIPEFLFLFQLDHFNPEHIVTSKIFRNYFRFKFVKKLLMDICCVVEWNWKWTKERPVRGSNPSDDIFFIIYLI